MATNLTSEGCLLGKVGTMTLERCDGDMETRIDHCACPAGTKTKDQTLTVKAEN